MKTRLLALTMIAGVCGFAAGPASAQLAAPNAAGVSIGHVHINASDVDAQVRFWTAVGGKVVQREKLTMVQFPGIYVLLRKQDYSGGTVGSTVNHFGFYVRDFDASVAKWKAAGLDLGARQESAVGQGFLTGPDSVRIEIYENKSIPTPMQMHHIHLMVSDPLQAQQWYVQNFGAAAGKRAQYDVANVPGTEITLGQDRHATGADEGALARSHRVRGEEHRRVRREAAGGGHQDGRGHPQQRQCRRDCGSSTSPIPGAPRSKSPKA